MATEPCCRPAAAVPPLHPFTTCTPPAVHGSITDRGLSACISTMMHFDLCGAPATLPWHNACCGGCAMSARSATALSPPGSVTVQGCMQSQSLSRPAVSARQVTTLLDKVEERGALQRLDPQQLEELKQRVSAQGSAVKEAKAVRILRQDSRNVSSGFYRDSSIWFASRSV